MNTKTTSPTPAEILGDAQLTRLEFNLLYSVLKQRQAVISANMGQLSSALQHKKAKRGTNRKNFMFDHRQTDR